jgi:hypothetical protein
MKIIINKNSLKENPAQFLRRANYGFIQDRRRGTESFARRIGRDHYPRFHVYIKHENDRIIFDMHLDQKQASYAGAHAHNAEYGGEAVEREINRLKSLLGINDVEHGTHNVEHKMHNTERGTQNNTIKDISSAEDKIGNRDIMDKINEPGIKEEKKSWFKKIFN